MVQLAVSPLVDNVLCSTNSFPNTVQRSSISAGPGWLREKSLPQPKRRSTTACRCSGLKGERDEFLVHELRNLLNTALVAFDVLSSGRVGISGSTGNVLRSNLLALRDLISHSLDDVRHARGLVHNLEPFLVSNFIEEL